MALAISVFWSALASVVLMAIRAAFTAKMLSLSLICTLSTVSPLIGSEMLAMVFIVTVVVAVLPSKSDALTV